MRRAASDRRRARIHHGTDRCAAPGTGEAGVCDRVRWRRPRNRRDRGVLALLSGVRLDLSRLPMSDIRSWAGYMATFAVALAPSLLVLSAGRIGRLLRRVAPSRAEMRRQPKASQPR